MSILQDRFLFFSSDLFYNIINKKEIALKMNYL